MNSVLIYLLEVSITLIALFGLYHLMLRKETYYSFNRCFLIGILVISFFLPMISFDLSIDGSGLYNDQVKELGNTRSAYHMVFTNWTKSTSNTSSELESGFHKFWKKDWDSMKILFIATGMIYVCGLIFFLVQLISAYLRVIKMKKSVKSHKWKGINVAKIPANIAPFSFLNTVFIPEDIDEKDEFDQILAHEKIHVQQRHSIDLIIVQLLAAFLWFNPVVWLLVKSLKQTHEYIADKNMLQQGFSLVAYQTLLLRQLISNNSYGLVHNFNFSFIKKRITMMSIKESGWTGKSKAVIALSLTVLLGLMTAQSNELLKVNSPMDSPSTYKMDMQFFIDGVKLKDGLKFSEIKDADGQFKFELSNDETDRIQVALQLIRKGRKMASVNGTLQENNELGVQELLAKAELEDYLVIDIIEGPSEVDKLYNFPLFRESDGWRRNQGNDMPPAPVRLFVDGVEVDGQNGIALRELEDKNFDVALEYVLSESVDFEVMKGQAGDVTTNLVRKGKALKSTITTGVKRKDTIPLNDLLKLAEQGDAIVIQIGDPDGLQIAWMFMLK